MNITDPIVAVDRAARSIAVFDGPTLVREFEPYLNEDKGIIKAKFWLLEHTQAEPRIVYPRIDKLNTAGASK